MGDDPASASLIEDGRFYRLMCPRATPPPLPSLSPRPQAGDDPASASSADVHIILNLSTVDLPAVATYAASASRPLKVGGRVGGRGPFLVMRGSRGQGGHLRRLGLTLAQEVMRAGGPSVGRRGRGGHIILNLRTPLLPRAR